LSETVLTGDIRTSRLPITAAKAPGIFAAG
jgi:hypothetical protein